MQRLRAVLVVTLVTSTSVRAGSWPFAIEGDFIKGSTTTDVSSSKGVDVVFCENAGDTVLLPDPSDPAFGTINKGVRHGNYLRQIRVVAVAGACTITTVSGGLSISAPASSSVATLSTADACGGTLATGQAVTLVTDGTKFHVVAYACGPAPAPPASSASTSSGASTSTATLASLELRIARMEAAAAGGSLSYDVSFTLTVESSVDAATYDVSGLKTALASMLGVSESLISITVVAGSLVITATISTTSSDAAAKLVIRLGPVVASPGTASASLGVTVIGVTQPSVTTSVIPAPAAPPGPPSPPSPPPRPPASPLPPQPPLPPAAPPSPPATPSPPAQPPLPPQTPPASPPPSSPPSSPPPSSPPPSSPPSSPPPSSPPPSSPPSWASLALTTHTTSCQEMGNTADMLDRHTIDCPAGTALAGFRIKTSDCPNANSNNADIRYEYNCVEDYLQGARSTFLTECTDVAGQILFLDRFGDKVFCGSGEVLTGFKFLNSCSTGGSWEQYQYTCAPTTAFSVDDPQLYDTESGCSCIHEDYLKWLDRLDVPVIAGRALRGFKMVSCSSSPCAGNEGFRDFQTLRTRMP